MSKRKYNIRKKFIIALLCTAVAGSMLLTGCNGTASDSSEASDSSVSSSQNTESNNSGSTVSASESTASTVSFDTEDKDESYDESGSTKITLSGSSASVSGSGAEVNGTTITISKAGTYVISGTIDDGNIVIDAGKDDVVKLVLNNAEINSKTTSAIYASKCSKTILLLQDGTTNSVSDGSDYVTSTDSDDDDTSSTASTTSESSDSDDSDSDSPNAAIYIKDDLTILGNGTLNVTGNANNGITSKDTLRITSGTINVTAAHHGINGKDNLAIENGKITVTATTGDGLRSTYSKDNTEKGNVHIENGEITITCGKDGIQAERNLTINNGTITITAGGGAASSSSSNNSGFGFGGDGNSNSSTESIKGLKAGEDLTVNGGTVTVNSYDDSLHSNGDLTITGGTITVKSSDDGVHTDNILTIKNGTVTVEQSYEGLEGNIINISGGTIDVTASDDGINCSGGNDGSGFGGMDGNMQFGRGGGMRGASADTQDIQNNANITLTAATTDNSSDNSSSETPALNISGGTVYVNAQGDGLDSNGDLTISGGTIVVNGTTSSGNGILDHDGTCIVTGGTLIGAGTSGMLEMPSDSSTQKTIAVLFDQSQSANTLVYITDSSGNVLAAMTPEKNYGCVIFSSAELKSGETYKVYVGGTATGDSTHGYYSKAVVANGTEYTSFTLGDDTVTYINASGITTYSGGMGGGRGNFNGGQMIDQNNTSSGANGQMPDNGQIPNDGQMPNGGQMPDRNGDMQIPDQNGSNNSTDNSVNSSTKSRKSGQKNADGTTSGNSSVSNGQTAL